MEKNTSDISPVADVNKEATQEPQPKADGIDYKAQYESLSKQFAEMQSKQVEADRKAQEKERANKEKNGKFEELYNEQKEVNKKQAEQFKKTQIENELKLSAKDMGLKKLEYLAMLDRDGIDLSEDGTIFGMTEKLNTFKEKYPEFFGETSGKDQNAHNNEERIRVPYTDNRRITTNQRVHYDKAEELTQRLPKLQGKEYRRTLGEVARNKLSKHIFNK